MYVVFQSRWTYVMLHTYRICFNICDTYVAYFAVYKDQLVANRLRMTFPYLSCLIDLHTNVFGSNPEEALFALCIYVRSFTIIFQGQWALPSVPTCLLLQASACLPLTAIVCLISQAIRQISKNIYNFYQ